MVLYTFQFGINVEEDRELLMKGEIECVVLHTNTMADLDYEAYDVAVAWMEEHGDEVVPD